MGKKTCLLSVGAKGSVLHCADGKRATAEFSEAVSASDIAALLYEFLKSNKALDGNLIFGIDSRQVYFLETNFDRTTIQNADALKFSVEPMVPVDAEDLAVWVDRAGAIQRTFVWDMRGTRELLIALNEQHGVTFDAFVPSELVWLQCQKLASGDHLVLRLDTKSTEQFEFDGDHLVNWEYMASPRSELADGCKTIVVDSSVDTSNFDTQEVLLRDEILAHSLRKNQKVENLQYNFAENLESTITNSQSPWQSVLLASLFVLLGIAGSLWYRSEELKKDKISADASSAEVFRELFPRKRIRGAVDSLLERELKRQQGINALASHADTSATVLENLRDFLAASRSMNGTRFQFDSIKLGVEAITISGRVEGFDEFQTLKMEFDNGGFSIGPSTRYGDPFTLVLVKDTSSAGTAATPKVTEVARKSQ